MILKDDKKTKYEDMEPKERKKARKMQKDNYELSMQAKEIWEKLRTFVVVSKNDLIFYFIKFNNNFKNVHKRSDNV